VSRASDFTALVALNFFFFFRFVVMPSHKAQSTAHYAIIASIPLPWRAHVEEREMFDEKEQKRSHTLTCPHCRQAAEYDLAWLVRTKKRQLPSRADERDRARFAKARSYMVRRDDLVACKNLRCRKRFEVAGVQSVAFLE
jgi:hypothetical protein